MKKLLFIVNPKAGKSAIKNDIIISGAMAALFSIVAAFLIYKFTNSIQKAIIWAIVFFFIIYIIGFSHREIIVG